MRHSNILGATLIALAIVLASALWSHAQAPTVIAGRDPKTGQTVPAVADIQTQSIRTRVVGTDPPLVNPGVKVVGPLGNLLGGSVGNAPVSVVVVANRAGDPCAGMKANAAISQTGNAKIVSAYPGHRLVICSIVVVGSDAENLSLVEGGGVLCANNTAAVIGGATAANGPNLAANGGFSMGDGSASIAVQASAANDFCLFQSGSGRVAGVLTYAFTP